MAVLDEEKVACVLRAFQLYSRPEHLASHAGLYDDDIDRHYVYRVLPFLWSSGPIFSLPLGLTSVLATVAARRYSVNS